MKFSEEEKNYIIEDFKVLMDYYRRIKHKCTFEEHTQYIEDYFKKLYKNITIKVEGKKLFVDEEFITEYKND